MNKAAGSALMAIALSSTLFHGTHAWTGSPAAASQPDVTTGDETSKEPDAGKCYPFEVVLRHRGIADVSSSGQNHPPGLACDDKGYYRAFGITPDEAAGKVLAPKPVAAPKKPSGAKPAVASEKLSASNQVIDVPLLQILIATVPNPLETSDALEFDRTIAALQEAGSTAGYHFELMLTPWLISDLEEPKGAKKGREAQTYRQAFGDEPGAMLFRCDYLTYDCPTQYMLLLLVPESPAYGLNMHAAWEAIAAYDTLWNSHNVVPPDPIRWIGPEYSASVQGLHQLEQTTRPPQLLISHEFCVLSGSVTTDVGDQQIRRINSEGPGDAIDNHCTTAMRGEPTVSALDLESLNLLLSQPAFREGTNRGPIVVLSEDETAYGASLRLYDKRNDQRTALVENRDAIRQFIFPRGIAHVRGVYGSSLRDATAAELSQGRLDPLMNFSDALQQPLDTGEEFAAQSPVSNESVLASIAASLTHIDARAVIILATDPLDQLFLARYFHRHAPDTRLVLFNAERLLTRLRGDFNLDGTIVVSRFPLFQDAYMQAPNLSEHRHPLSFTSSNQEGVFLAALAQIWPHDIQQQPFYTAEKGHGSWIEVSGGGDFWPVFYQQERRSSIGTATASNPPAAASQAAGVKETGSASPCTIGCEQGQGNEANNSFLLVDTPDEGLPTVWSLVLATILVGSALHLILFVVAGPMNGRVHRLPGGWNKLTRHRLLSFYFLFPYAIHGTEADRRGRKELCLGQCWWLFNITAVFSLALNYLLLPAILYRAKMAGVECFSAVLYLFLCRVRWLGFFAMVVEIGLAFLMIRLAVLYLGEWNRSKKDNRQRYGSPLPLLGSSVWMIVSLSLFCCQIADAGAGWAFSIRCLHLSSGVCPILPLLLASTALLAIAAGNLNMLTLPVGRYPGLPKIEWEALDMDNWKMRLNCNAEDWTRLPGPEGYLLLAGLIVSWAIFHPGKVFATFDDQSISYLYLMTFVVCLWLVLTLSLRFYKTWSTLRFGLESLEGSPLRFAFSRLPKIFSLEPIWSYAGLRRQVVLPARALEYLRVAPEVSDQLRSLTVDRAAPRLMSMSAQVGNSQQTDNLTFLRVSSLMNRYATRLSELQWIQDAWKLGGPDVVTDPEAKAACCACPDAGPQLSLKPREDVPARCDAEQKAEEACNLGLANEYIAVRVVMFIRFFMLHLKNMMTFMSVATLFMVLAAVSYPFNEPRAILWGIASLVAFLLLIVGMFIAQMDRDATLSRLSATVPGEVDRLSFVYRLALAGGLPALTVLASIFPTLGNAIASLLRPVLQSLH